MPPPDHLADDERLPAEAQRLVDMLRPDYFEASDGRHWAEVFFNFTVGPEPEWEVEWTGFNLPGNPNVCHAAPTLAEACQKCIDAIEADRAALHGAGETE